MGKIYTYEWVEIKSTDGSQIRIDNDKELVQDIIRAYRRMVDGLSYTRAFSVVNADGNTEWYQLNCICGIIEGPLVEEEVADRPCEDLNCIPDYPGQTEA